MQIILLEKVVNLGNLGEVVSVKDGYARNFLIPQKIAKRATESALKEFEARRAELEKVQADKLAASQAVGEKLEGHAVRHFAKGRCRWPSVRFGNQHGHRRRAGQARFFLDREIASAFARWPA